MKVDITKDEYWLVSGILASEIVKNAEAIGEGNKRLGVMCGLYNKLNKAKYEDFQENGFGED